MKQVDQAEQVSFNETAKQPAIWGFILFGFVLVFVH